jgi:hypothetical protein
MTKKGQGKTHVQRDAEYRARQKAQGPEFRTKRAAQEQGYRRKKKAAKTAALQGAMLLEAGSKNLAMLLEAGSKNHKLAASHMENIYGMGIRDQTEQADAHTEQADAEQEGRDDDEGRTDAEPQCTEPKWKRGIPIVLPLTEESREIRFNMDEDMCITSMALLLCHEAIERYLPTVPKPGLGGALNQVDKDLPYHIANDLWCIHGGRTKLQHNKWRKYHLDHYERRMKRVIGFLCPNWKLIHYYRSTDVLHEEIAALKRQLENQNKRPRDDDHRVGGGVHGTDDYDYMGGGSAKRCRTDADGY